MSLVSLELRISIKGQAWRAPALLSGKGPLSLLIRSILQRERQYGASDSSDDKPQEGPHPASLSAEFLVPRVQRW